MKQLETLTPNAIAKMLRRHPLTVTRLAREGLSAVPTAQAGKFPGFKVGGICLPARLCGGALPGRMSLRIG